MSEEKGKKKEGEDKTENVKGNALCEILNNLVFMHPSKILMNRMRMNESFRLFSGLQWNIVAKIYMSQRLGMICRSQLSAELVCKLLIGICERYIFRKCAHSIISRRLKTYQISK